MAKIILTTVLGLGLTLATCQAQTVDWKIECNKNSDECKLANIHNPLLSHSVTLSGGIPRFERVQKLVGSGFTIEQLIYYSGTAGTSSPYKMYYALAFDPKNQKILGDFPYEDRPLKKGLPVEKTSWSIKQGKLIITNSEDDYQEVIELKK